MEAAATFFGGPMKVRRSIAAIGATALVGTGAFVLPALASASSTTHTLKFISKEKNSVMFTKASGGQQDTDVNAKGKTIGYDELYFTAASATTGAVNVALDTTGGFLYGTLTVNFKTGKISNGKVTGGTGAFKGAAGTITAKNLNAKGTITAVTVKYHV